ncbi:hypothetical protein PROFUN_04780 [Planoprotostelium fungivorum]|uniref:Uncharacterized protein n=1 Tax=Planoprotostelium fungivorum TaxID=1890364 RepID=A0A2P6NSV8_9EUKA|nr:hypothetical protein PROFUN_04780 [Planoprotostelium fungivorum]
MSLHQTTPELSSQTSPRDLRVSSKRIYSLESDDLFNLSLGEYMNARKNVESTMSPGPIHNSKYRSELITTTAPSIARKWARALEGSDSFLAEAIAPLPPKGLTDSNTSNPSGQQEETISPGTMTRVIECKAFFEAKYNKLFSQIETVEGYNPLAERRKAAEDEKKKRKELREMQDAEAKEKADTEKKKEEEEQRQRVESSDRLRMFSPVASTSTETMIETGATSDDDSPRPRRRSTAKGIQMTLKKLRSPINIRNKKSSDPITEEEGEKLDLRGSLEKKSVSDSASEILPLPVQPDTPPRSRIQTPLPPSKTLTFEERLSVSKTDAQRMEYDAKCLQVMLSHSSKTLDEIQKRADALVHLQEQAEREHGEWEIQMTSEAIISEELHQVGRNLKEVKQGVRDINQDLSESKGRVSFIASRLQTVLDGIQNIQRLSKRAAVSWLSSWYTKISSLYAQTPAPEPTPTESPMTSRQHIPLRVSSVEDLKDKMESEEKKTTSEDSSKTRMTRAAMLRASRRQVSESDLLLELSKKGLQNMSAHLQDLIRANDVKRQAERERIKNSGVTAEN